MLQLIEHIIRISSKRDRSEINSALVDAVRDIFDPPAMAVHRCYQGAGDTIVFTCAGLEASRTVLAQRLPARAPFLPPDRP